MKTITLDPKCRKALLQIVDDVRDISHMLAHIIELERDRSGFGPRDKHAHNSSHENAGQEPDF